MKLRVLGTIIALIIALLHTSQLSVLVYQADVDWHRGEAGPGLDCYYLGTYGPFRVGYDYSAEPTKEKMCPAPRQACSWTCLATWHRHPPGMRATRYARCAGDDEGCP